MIFHKLLVQAWRNTLVKLLLWLGHKFQRLCQKHQYVSPFQIICNIQRLELIHWSKLGLCFRSHLNYRQLFRLFLLSSCIFGSSHPFWRQRRRCWWPQPHFFRSILLTRVLLESHRSNNSIYSNLLINFETFKDTYIWWSCNQGIDQYVNDKFIWNKVSSIWELFDLLPLFGTSLDLISDKITNWNMGISKFFDKFFTLCSFSWAWASYTNEKLIV